MPRAKRTPGVPGYGPPQAAGQAGATQAPAAPTGMAYGAHQASIQAQQSMPLAAAQPADLMQRALAAATATPPPGLPLGAPTARPDEPLLAGLQPATAGTPPPPVAQAVAPPPLSNTAAAWRAMAELYPQDPYYAQQASEAERRNL